MKTKLMLITALATALALNLSAQVTDPAQNTPVIPDPIIAAPVKSSVLDQLHTLVPNIVGTVFTAKDGQSFVISTNADGGYTAQSYGVNGTQVTVAPTSPQQVFAAVSQWFGNNDPSLSRYYGTNELVGRLGAAYQQNSGQAVAFISVTKYGLFGWQHIGFGGGVLQGNNGSKVGTAGVFGKAVYRKVIGDVSADGGLVFGYDLWDRQVFAGATIAVEHRQNAHLGEFVELTYAAEPGAKTDKGMLISGGISYAF